MTSTKLAVDNKSVSVSLKPKLRKFISLLSRRIIMKKTYFARLDKGKSSDVDTEVSKPMSKPTVR